MENLSRARELQGWQCVIVEKAKKSTPWLDKSNYLTQIKRHDEKEIYLEGSFHFKGINWTHDPFAKPDYIVKLHAFIFQLY